MNMLLSEMVMDIPFSVNVSGALSPESLNCPYMVLFSNGTTALIPLSKMAPLIPPPPVSPSPANGADALLPPFLQLNSCITYEPKGQYHKGFLGQRYGVFQFSFKSHVNKKKGGVGGPPSQPSIYLGRPLRQGNPNSRPRITLLNWISCFLYPDYV
jgi:hypothetical protein